ncbi:MAG: NAD(P)H-dependent oxidoreductase [Candidatus Hodarchaeales archaeon]|jgi:multimeric flavodoxin WrbA
MKILAIIGSNRKKNTYNLVKKFENQIKSHTQVDFEYLYLKDFNLPFCRGCHTCLQKSEEKCPAYEVTNSLIKKTDTADGLIFASPVYLQHVPAIMKNFFDHFAYLEHRPRYFNKPVIILATSAGSGLRQVTSYLKKFTRAWGFNVLGVVGVKMIAYESNRYQKKIEKRIDLLSKKLINEIKLKTRRSPSISEITDFRIRRLITKASRNTSPIDYEYWERKNWLNDNYYTNVKIGPFKSILGLTTEIVAKFVLKLVYNL